MEKITWSWIDHVMSWRKRTKSKLELFHKLRFLYPLRFYVERKLNSLMWGRQLSMSYFVKKVTYFIKKHNVRVSRETEQGRIQGKRIDKRVLHSLKHHQPFIKRVGKTALTFMDQHANLKSPSNDDLLVLTQSLITKHAVFFSSKIMFSGKFFCFWIQYVVKQGRIHGTRCA